MIRLAKLCHEDAFSMKGIFLLFFALLGQPGVKGCLEVSGLGFDPHSDTMAMCHSGPPDHRIQI